METSGLSDRKKERKQERDSCSMLSEGQIQGGKAVCPRSHSWKGKDRGFKPKAILYCLLILRLSDSCTHLSTAHVASILCVGILPRCQGVFRSESGTQRYRTTPHTGLFTGKARLRGLPDTPSPLLKTSYIVLASEK